MIWEMNAMNQPSCGKVNGAATWKKSTYDAQNGGEEKEVVSENGREIKRFVSAWRHGWYWYNGSKVPTPHNQSTKLTRQRPARAGPPRVQCL